MIIILSSTVVHVQCPNISGVSMNINGGRLSQHSITRKFYLNSIFSTHGIVARHNFSQYCVSSLVIIDFVRNRVMGITCVAFGLRVLQRNTP